MDIVYVWIFLIGYGFGCLQSAYFISRWMGKIDIRDHGSGNAGMTNVTRVLGAKAGLIVFIFDIIKCIGAIMLANVIVFGHIFRVEYYQAFPGLLTGLGVILGHCFPFYLKFKGGKGIASMVGLIIMFDWRVMLISFSVALIIIIVSKFISLGSLIGLLTFAGVTPFFYNQIEIIIACIFLAALCIFMHRSNIKRIIKGTESRFSFGKK